MFPSILAIWRGGIVFLGSVIGGFISILIYSKKRKLKIWQFTDFIAVGLPLGSVLGRLGCVFAGCCWGKTVFHTNASGNIIQDLPIAMKFPPGSIAYDSIINSSNIETYHLMNKIGTTVPLFPPSIIVDSLFSPMTVRPAVSGQTIFSVYVPAST